MNPQNASCRPAAASRPQAKPLLIPAELAHRRSQPTLPWDPAQISVPPLVGVDPQLQRVGRALMAAMIEVMAGLRPPAQLNRWVGGSLIDLILELRNKKHCDGLRLHTSRVQNPSPHVLEVSAHLHHNGASRAAALRLTRIHDSWVATDLSIALTPHIISTATTPTV